MVDLMILNGSRKNTLEEDQLILNRSPGCFSQKNFIWARERTLKMIGNVDFFYILYAVKKFSYF